MNIIEIDSSGSGVPQPNVGTLPIVEIFGPTIQGEGPASGRLSSFVRFGGCNLSCSWCDSAYTWDGSQYNLREEITMLSPEEILKRIPDVNLIIVTGGEPLLHQNHVAFRHLMELLKAEGHEIHVETNGTIFPLSMISDAVDLFCVSPKLPHAGFHKRSQSPTMSSRWRELHESVDAHMKVVVITEDDVRRAREMAEMSGWPLQRVWIMPEGVSKDVLDLRWPLVCEWATKYGVNATHRLHVLSWGDERGH